MIPFSPPRIDQKIIDEVADTLRSGWITTGPKTKLFEKQLAQYAGVPNIICLNSATAGLEMMLRWFGVSEGDEVILPAYTYSATANVVMHCGARPVLVDVNANDFNISITEIAKAITERTKVIMPVDIGGLPCDYNAIMKLVCDKTTIAKFKPKTENQEKLGRILVLSDAAHSLGARYNNKVIGSQSDASVFSFHAVKNLTTAEGGAVCLNLPAPFDNGKIYSQLNTKSLHGQNKDALAKMQKGSWEYDVTEAGYKCNMPDILAAIGLVEFSRYESETLPKRKHICEQYQKAFTVCKWAQIPVFKDNLRESSYHLYMLRIKNITEKQRNKIIETIFNNEVSVNVHFKPLPLLTFYKNAGYSITDYPIAYDNYVREITLPVYYDLTEKQVQEIINTVNQSFEAVIG
jgi:dTDP-4-amino-4,6-dideoxygalactose transaminase